MEQEKVKALVEENIKNIFAYSLSRVSNKEDAEDLAGDIVVEILKSAGRIRDDNAFYGYIWAIAANTYKKFLTKRNKYVKTELDENIAEQDDFTEDICKAEELQILKRELALLSKEYRECTVAYYMEGLSCAETASKLNISPEMVKYYLFKTRKILKEGIGMVREFGEKSYNPAPFEMVTIFSGEFNREYQNLFKRKLPGNILLSAYYTPMTVGELAIELGVAAVFLEDEIKLLEEYKLIKALSGGKYQTNLVVFTEAYTKEFIREAEKSISEDVKYILQNVKKKLEDMRKIGFMGNDLTDNHLMWALLFEMMREGYKRFDTNRADIVKSEMYEGASDTNYGVDYDEMSGEYGCNGFAGYQYVNDNYAMMYADFGILPDKNMFSESKADIGKMLDAFHSGKSAVSIPVLTSEEKEAIEELLEEEIADVAKMYEKLSAIAADIMRSHAPKHILGMIDNIVSKTVFFRTVGLIGASAVHTGMLEIPEDNSLVTVLIYQEN